MPDERFPNDEIDNRLNDIDDRMRDIDRRTAETPYVDRSTLGGVPQDHIIREPQRIVETREIREAERKTAEDARAAYGRDTDTRVERVHDHEHDRGKVWPWVLGLAILGLVALPFLSHRNTEQASAPQPAIGTKQVGPAVNFQGKTYVGAGQAQAMAASDMVAVGKSTGGSTIYRARGGGGGAGTETYYLRRADGTFQPLAPYNP